MKPLRDYTGYVIIMAPLLNSMSGITIDLFAPSMPAIGAEFNVNAAQMQNSISVTLIAYAIGQLFFGLIADCQGRMWALLPGLCLFFAGSLLAIYSHSLSVFLLARAIQGFSVGACQVTARAMIVDNVKDERFHAAVAYLSLAWGLGPVIAPFIGGIIQQWLGWRWSFALYAFYSGVLFVLSLRLRESLPQHARMSLPQALNSFRFVLGSGRFLFATLSLGTSLALFLIWNVIGPFLIQHQMHRSPSFYGATALAAGLAYLLATIINRLLIKRIKKNILILGGIICGAIGILCMLVKPDSIELVPLLTGVILVNFGQGLLFSNMVALTMTLFPTRAGVTASLLGCGMMICGGVSSGFTGTVPLDKNWHIALLFFCLLALQTIGIVAAHRFAIPQEEKNNENQIFSRRP